MTKTPEKTIFLGAALTYIAQIVREFALPHLHVGTGNTHKKRGSPPERGKDSGTCKCFFLFYMLFYRNDNTRAKYYYTLI